MPFWRLSSGRRAFARNTLAAAFPARPPHSVSLVADPLLGSPTRVWGECGPIQGTTTHTPTPPLVIPSQILTPTPPRETESMVRMAGAWRSFPMKKASSREHSRGRDNIIAAQRTSQGYAYSRALPVTRSLQRCLSVRFAGKRERTLARALENSRPKTRARARALACGPRPRFFPVLSSLRPSLLSPTLSPLSNPLPNPLSSLCPPPYCFSRLPPLLVPPPPGVTTKTKRAVFSFSFSQNKQTKQSSPSLSLC